MTLQEFDKKIIDYQGPCMRFCAFCPEDHNTAEVKECIEEGIRQIYNLNQTIDDLMKELIKVRRAYKDATGTEYKGDSD